MVQLCSPQACRHPTRQDGFSLVEVLVSAALILIMGAGLLSVLDVSGASAGQNRQRAEAAALGRSAQQEYRTRALTRSPSVAPITVTTSRVVGNTTYTTVTSGAWESPAKVDPAGDCSSASPTGTVDQLRVRTSTTWPRMKIPAIVVESILLPPPPVEPTTGSVAVLVHTLDNTPVGAGIPVAVTGQATKFTNASGCVVFPTVTAGPATVSVPKTGWYDAGGLSCQKSIDVTAGLKTLVQILCGPTVNFTIKFETKNPADGVTGQSTTFADSTVLGRTASVLTEPAQIVGDPNTAVSSLTAGVMENDSGYGVYAGGCEGNDPTNYGEDMAAWTPGGPTTVNVRMPTVSVRGVIEYDEEDTYWPAKNMTIVATPDTTTSGTLMTADCLPAKWTVTGTAGELYSDPDNCYGTHSACGDTSTEAAKPNVFSVRRLRLPYGKWRLCVSTPMESKIWREDNILVDNTNPDGVMPARVQTNGGGLAYMPGLRIHFKERSGTQAACS